jgi:thiosulfate/3-mercaptopyruvate sulfurtransferase
MSARGIAADDTVVFYGDNFNWWAAYALWVFSLFGHRDVRLLDGGRQKWIAEGRPLTTEVVERPERVPDPDPGRHVDPGLPRRHRRALPDRQAAHRRPIARGVPGRASPHARLPNEGALRGGHIPGAFNVPWKRAAADDGTFRTVDELKAIYQEEIGLEPADEVISYCRIGERSSHTWFVLRYLLGFPHVRNYDGSWTEYGNAVRVPIER